VYILHPGVAVPLETYIGRPACWIAVDDAAVCLRWSRERVKPILTNTV